MKKEAYIDAVRSSLIANCGLERDDADQAIIDYDLDARIDRCPLISEHDDPKAMADVVVRKTLRL